MPSPTAVTKTSLLAELVVATTTTVVVTKTVVSSVTVISSDSDDVVTICVPVVVVVGIIIVTVLVIMGGVVWWKVRIRVVSHFVNEDVDKVQTSVVMGDDRLVIVQLHVICIFKLLSV